MNNIESEIGDNLYDFYDQISQICKIYSEKHDHWSVVRNIHNVWPRLIYRIDAEIVGQESSAIFSGKVKSGSYPEVLIASDESVPKIDPFLRSHGFYPFSAWKGMAIINVTGVAPPVLPETIQIVRCESSEDIGQWLSIVSSELVAPAHIDKALLESLIAQSEFEAYLLKYNGTGVSTILVFNTETSYGLYLIATQKSAQRQGFARLLVQQILSQIIKSTSSPIILHATQKGEAMYSKLGFLPYNQFFLYRYLNSEI